MTPGSHWWQALLRLIHLLGPTTQTGWIETCSMHTQIAWKSIPRSWFVKILYKIRHELSEHIVKSSHTTITCKTIWPTQDLIISLSCPDISLLAAIQLNQASEARQTKDSASCSTPNHDLWGAVAAPCNIEGSCINITTTTIVKVVEGLYRALKTYFTLHKSRIILWSKSPIACRRL